MNRCRGKTNRSAHTPHTFPRAILYNGLVLKPPGLRCLCDDLSCLSTTLWYGVSVLYFTHAHTYVCVCGCARAVHTIVCLAAVSCLTQCGVYEAAFELKMNTWTHTTVNSSLSYGEAEYK